MDRAHLEYPAAENLHAVSMEGPLVAPPSEERVAQFLRPARPGRWWVLHARARAEKTIAEALEKSGIDHYLPLVPVVHRYGRRRVTNHVPLFPGYLFLWGEPEECLVAQKTNRVANLLPVAAQKQMQKDLEQVYRVVASGAPVDLYPALRPGKACRIIRGSLMGVEGVVIRRRNVSRVYIAATFIGQSAVVEVDTADVEALD